MLVNFMKSRALDILKEEIPKNIALYNSKDRWIDKYFEEKGLLNYSFNTGIMVPDVILTIGDSKTDYENAVKIHEAFKEKLNPVQASDLRLWAYLAHNVYWDYMRARWAIDMPSEDDDDASGDKLIARIGARYFFKASKGKAFVRQGIARLFWSAYLTYDEENKEDPYELTQYFLSKQDIFAVSTERSLARNKTLLVAALKILKENGELNRAQIRRYFLSLNQSGGVIILDSLSKKDADELAKRTLDDILGKTDNIQALEREMTSNSDSTYKQPDSGDSKTKVDNREIENTIKRVEQNSKIVVRNIKNGIQMPIVVNRTAFNTKPSLIGLTIGDRFKIRKELWEVVSIK